MSEKRTCDACGNDKAFNSIGGAQLCRLCADAVRTEIDATRMAGKQPNAIGIARKMYREALNTNDLLLRDIPGDLLKKLKIEAATTGKTVREIVIDKIK